MATAVGLAQAGNRAGSWLLPGRCDRTGRSLRSGIRKRRRPVRPSGGAIIGNPADAVDVADPDGCAQGQGVLLHWRFYKRARGLGMAFGESSLSAREARE